MRTLKTYHFPSIPSYASSDAGLSEKGFSLPPCTLICAEGCAVVFSTCLLTLGAFDSAGVCSALLEVGRGSGARYTLSGCAG